MYTWVNNMPRVTCYREALAHWDKVKPVRGRADGCKPIAHRRGWNRRMRLEPDGTVVFTLFQTDVVAWHPNDTVTVTNHPTISTSIFAGSLLPPGVYLRARGVLVIAPPEGYFWRHPTEVRIVSTEGGPLTLTRGPRAWELAKGQTPLPLRYSRLNKTRAAELRRKYSVREFRTWCAAAEKLGALNVDTGGDPRMCAEALLRGDFLTAGGLLRATTRWYTDAGTWNKTILLSDNSFRQVRDYIYRSEGALDETILPEMTLAEYRRLVVNNRY